ncbi:hypothetical protein J6590_084154 [Homalodisca vitripennis]|nr:hypothetical protein J6590_084154 [Homalodisca vitripennis]
MLGRNVPVVVFQVARPVLCTIPVGNVTDVKARLEDRRRTRGNKGGREGRQGWRLSGASGRRDARRGATTLTPSTTAPIHSPWQEHLGHTHKHIMPQCLLLSGPTEAKWPRERVFKLIELYREQTVLWDPTCREFKDKNLKNSAWTEIALAMKLSRSELSDGESGNPVGSGACIGYWVMAYQLSIQESSPCHTASRADKRNRNTASDCIDSTSISYEYLPNRYTVDVLVLEPLPCLLSTFESVAVSKLQVGYHRLCVRGHGFPPSSLKMEKRYSTLKIAREQGESLAFSDPGSVEWAAVTLVQSLPVSSIHPPSQLESYDSSRVNHRKRVTWPGNKAPLQVYCTE